MRAVAATIAAFAVLAAPAGAAASGTQETIFHGFTPTGKPTIPTKKATGYCFGGAIAIPRADAWRCFVGNYIYDPCFSSARARSSVVCPNAAVTGGTEIRLTKPLPRHLADTGSPNARDAPWDIETVTSSHCVAVTGATTLIDRQPLRYMCRGNVGLWGSPNRSSRPLWTILVAPENAKRLFQRVGIRHVWM